MNYIKHFLSIIIMLIIPFFVYTGLELLLFKDDDYYNEAEQNLTKEEYRKLIEEDEYRNEKNKKIHEISRLTIGISIILLSYYFKLDVWGVSAGGTILILTYLIPKLFKLTRGMQFIVAGISIIILTYIVNEYFNKKKI